MWKKTVLSIYYSGFSNQSKATKTRDSNHSLQNNSRRNSIHIPSNKTSLIVHLNRTRFVPHRLLVVNATTICNIFRLSIYCVTHQSMTTFNMFAYFYAQEFCCKMSFYIGKTKQLHIKCGHTFVRHAVTVMIVAIIISDKFVCCFLCH